MKIYPKDKEPILEHRGDSRVSVCELCGVRLADAFICVRLPYEPYETITAEICGFCYFNAGDDNEIVADLLYLEICRVIEETDKLREAIRELTGVSEKATISLQDFEKHLTELTDDL